jgi:hypothetical protein
MYEGFMKVLTGNIIKWTGVAAVALSLSVVTGQSAQAGQLDTTTGWDYSIGLSSNGSGGAEYALTGLAIKQDANNIYIAINGGTDPTTGSYENGATNNNINYGDLFFNFSGQDFATANANSSLYGIHFATNTASVSATGVYSGVQAKSVALTHVGYGSLQQYFDYGWGSQSTEGTDLDTQDKTKAYYGNNGTGPIYNVIDSGKKTGDISSLSLSQLSNLGLNFGAKGANSDYTFGFELSKSAIAATGSFIANVFYECGNSGIAVAGSIDAPPAGSEPVPEPLTILGMLAGGSGLAAMKKRRSLKSVA